MPHTKDSHPAHVASRTIAVSALRRFLAGTRKIVEVWNYEGPWALFNRGDFNTIVTVPQTAFERKLQAIRAHASQVARTPYDVAAESLARLRAAWCPNRSWRDSAPFPRGWMRGSSSLPGRQPGENRTPCRREHEKSPVWPGFSGSPCEQAYSMENGFRGAVARRVAHRFSRLAGTAGLITSARSFPILKTLGNTVGAEATRGATGQGLFSPSSNAPSGLLFSPGRGAAAKIQYRNSIAVSRTFAAGKVARGRLPRGRACSAPEAGIRFRSESARRTALRLDSSFNFDILGSIEFCHGSRGFAVRYRDFQNSSGGNP